MSRARHMEHEMREEEHERKEKRAKGGKVEPDIHSVTYAGQGSNVEKEAEEKKHGGKVEKKKKFKRGGKVDGMKAHKRLDRPGRKRGGSAGSDMHPLTTASKITPAMGHKDTMDGDADEGP